MEQVKLADIQFWEDEGTTAEGHARLRAKVGGMHCSLCTGIIERALRKQPGVHTVSVSLPDEQAPPFILPPLSFLLCSPRGSGLSKEGETALDVTAYAAHIAAQLGAHVIKVKLPTAHLEQAAAKKVYEKEGVPIGMLAERVRHVVQAAFDGRRIVIFSGGAADTDETVFEQVRAIRDGGGFGSIIGRNSFQRKRPDAFRFLKTVMDIYSGATK